MLSGTISYHSPFNPRPPVPGPRRLEAEMRKALAAGAFALHYQPRLDLATGAVRGCEALLRWPARKRHMLPPSVLILAAERSTLICDLGAWVLAEACTEARRWGGTQVSVNVSGRQLQSGVLPSQLAEALDRSGLPPERLELELNEAALADDSIDTLLALSAVRDLGVGLALDNFGTGWASLAMLKRLPLTTLKLDRSLVRGLPDSREDAALVRAMIRAAHVLGLGVVAGGIETEAQRAYLAALGCDQGQGYLFNHPLPAERVRPVALQPVAVQPVAVQQDTACGAPRSAPASAHDRHTPTRHTPTRHTPTRHTPTRHPQPCPYRG